MRDEERRGERREESGGKERREGGRRSRRGERSRYTSINGPSYTRAISTFHARFGKSRLYLYLFFAF